MKRYFCIVLVVSGALWSSGSENWTVSGNAFTVTINVAGK
ncbi:small toxic inner membrane protein TimP [Kalamiella sp. sgz302252]